ncbi:MAG: glycosyltransferase family 4 protein [Coleofasciculus sp. S288]|nr:glycosyltransferase family 4 protein [Coleofasciculus sp. S288]
MTHLRSPVPIQEEPAKVVTHPSTEQSSASRLKVAVRPWWHDNPYQKLLAEHLEKLGVEVKGVGSQTHLPLSEGKLNILHLHWLHPVFLAPSLLESVLNLVKFISGLVILRVMGTKIVWTAHNLKDHESRYSQLDYLCTKLVTRLSHRIIAHGEVAKQEIAKAFQMKSDCKISVVPHGSYIGCYDNQISSIEARNALGLSESSFVLLFLGSIRPYKGVLELIAAFKQLQHPNLQLVIAGKPFDEETPALIEQAIAGRDDIKFIPGFVPDSQIQVYMNACDVVVFPYRDILTSGAVLLAMSFGRACIAPRKGCIRETLDDSGAFLYDPAIESGLLQAMNQAIQKRAEVSRMGEHNHQLAEQWNWHRIAELTLNVYQSCLRG